MAGPTKAAQAALKRQAAMARIRDVWTARNSVQYSEVQRVTANEVVSALGETDWEEEYFVQGKNTHVIIIIIHRNKFNIT